MDTILQIAGPVFSKKRNSKLDFWLSLRQRCPGFQVQYINFHENYVHA